MHFDTQQPKVVYHFIDGQPEVLNAEIMVDGQKMTVTELAKRYEDSRLIGYALASLAIIIAIILVGTVSWFSQHPLERVVAVDTLMTKPGDACSTVGTLEAFPLGVMKCSPKKTWELAPCTEGSLISKDDFKMPIICDGVRWTHLK